jgi:transcriptional regulator with XRE-family HTH domain
MTNNALAEVGTNLKYLRIRRRMTIAQVAELSGISGGHISKIERGLADPTTGVLNAILKAMGYQADFYDTIEGEQIDD